MGVNRRHRVFVPQLAIRHCLEIELLYLPKSENEEHIKTKGGLNEIRTIEKFYLMLMNRLDENQLILSRAV